MRASRSLAVYGGESSPDICYTASVRRSHHEHRLALVAHSHLEFTERIQGFLKSEVVVPFASFGSKVSDHRSKLVFGFPGQGSQWVGMGRQLMESEPVFRATLEQYAQAMQPYVDWSLLEELTVRASRWLVHRGGTSPPW